MHCIVSPQRTHPLSNADDRDLIQHLEAGQKTVEDEAFQVIYRRYARLVYGLALRIICSAEDAEDITQEIFLGLHHQGGYDASRGSLKNFLAMNARSRAIDRLRSHKTQHKTLTHLRLSVITQPPTSSPIEQAIRAQIAQRLRSAISELPLTQREVLENTYYKGLSQSEISHQLSVPLGTVKSRSRQGLQKLRCALSEE